MEENKMEIKCEEEWIEAESGQRFREWLMGCWKD